MRVMLVHPGVGYSVADVHRGWKRALMALGCTVGDINFDDRLVAFSAMHKHVDGEWVKSFSVPGVMHLVNDSVLADAYKFVPDVCIVVSGFFLQPRVLDLMRERGTKVVLIHTEEPYELEADLQRAEHASVSLVNDPTNLEKFRAIGPAWYSGHCYDPDVHFPRKVLDRYHSDFAFVGTGYPSRIEFFEQVDWSGLDVVLGGNWEALDEHSRLLKFIPHAREECMSNDDAVLHYCGTKVAANLYRTELRGDTSTADGYAIGPREVELAACGAFFLREPRAEGDELFPFLPTFSDPDEFSELLHDWVDHPKERATCAAAARNAIADRTFDNAAKKLLSHFV